MNEQSRIKHCEIIEMEILNGIDRLFHQLNVTFGYGNEFINAYAESLKEMLPEYIEKQCQQSQYAEQLSLNVAKNVTDSTVSK